MAKAKNYTEDERVIGAFLNNFRMVDVMRETGLSKKTCYKIRNDPEFQKVIRERKEAILKTAVNKMQGYLTKDVEILQQIIEDPETSAQTKVNAIQTLMNQLRDWTTTTDIMKKLEALQNTSGNVSDTV
jgi:hypothetical protein